MSRTIIGKVGLTPKKDYDLNTSYKRLDLVSYEGSSYVCLKDCIGILPTNDIYWQLSASKGDLPINGVDYNTPEEKEEFKEEIIADSKIEIDNYTTNKTLELETKTSELIGDLESQKDSFLSEMEVEKNLFDTNASEKTTSFDKNAENKIADFNVNASEKISSFNTNAKTLTNKFNENSESKTSEFNENATTKTTSFDKNAEAKITEYNNNATTKLEEYNSNATEKTNTFNSNAEDKTTAFDTNADTKQTEYNNNATTKLEEYNSNATTKVEEFNENAESLEKRIATLEDKQVKEYGVRYYFGQASSTLERLGDAIGLTARATKDGSYVENDFDNAEIFKYIKPVKRDKKAHKLLSVKGDADYDDIEGEEMVDYPETYWKFELDENKKFVDIKLRNVATSGYVKVNTFSVGAKPLSSDPDGNLQTKSGYCAKGWTSRTNFRNLIKSQYGDGACLLDWRYQVILFLYLIEFADFNTQKVLGQMHSTFRFDFASDKALIEETSTNRIIIANGSFVIGQQIGIGTSDGGTQIAKERTVTSMKKYDDGTVTGYEIAFDGDPVNITTASAVMTYSQKTGSTDDIQASSGCMADDGKHGARYRYFEFNSIFDWIDGYIIEDGKIYFSNNPEDYNDTDTSKFNVLSYALSTAFGWIKELGFDTNNPFCMFPTITGNGAGSSTYITDYTWCNPKGVFAPRVSGSPNGGAGVGAFCWGLNRGASAAAWYCGARVLFDQI